jgi:hypothetical protein
MFEHQRRRCKGAAATAHEPEIPDPPGDNDVDEEVDDEEIWDGGGEEYEWKKKVVDALCQWIETEGCRRDFLDKYFNNPADLHHCKSQF